MNRAESQDACDELSRHLSGLFPGAACSPLDKAAIEAAWGALQDTRPDKQVKWFEADRRLLIPIVDPASRSLASGVELRFDRKIDPLELRLAKAITWVFNGDLKLAPRLGADQELWLSLQQTRFSRAIGRYTSFKTDVLVRWLRSIENAATLKYEGTSFSIRLLLCVKLSHVTSAQRFEVSQLTQPIPAAKALFSSKWIRALSQSGDINLVAKTSNVCIVGILRPLPRLAPAGLSLAPHSSLTDFCDRTHSKTIAFVASPAGDLFVACPNGGTFLKRQGHWHFLNYVAVVALLRRHIGSNAELLAQAVLNLSYERKGALFVIPSPHVPLQAIVPDAGAPGRANEELRTFAATLSLCPDDLSLIQDIAAIDGAVVISPDSSVLDCSCMISRPDPEALANTGFEVVQQFDGARTTAAWNASIHGLAIKVSEDGPVTFWERGQKVFALG